ncbi:molybdopterin synthase sulfur carrier subunit [Planomicrobium stackebrandtii]|uniref:Molybdopterin synthase sulfur carrier subunit n=1 Tax=Planomicrobium stackebrandtii TaxID=253160 RepID=A0ABU0GPE1_9BACL|nr:MoaD/ThiS family protein [Planomicrobium stackebrandtii]MDQ0427233.1 molybdopterin synthase sulfur carrier subunit [Planomicrobium stackebrandtii]
MITVQYFAGVRNITDKTSEIFGFAEKSVGELQKLLEEKYGGLKGSSVQFAVNEEYVLSSELLKDGDIVALIPPVSGG